jgi:hypothetical protein
VSLVVELKRRKVFKVGAAYLVVAWLAVQVVSIAFPAFEAPAWALRVFILLAMLGFPAALLLAWAFDATPDGLRRDVSATGSKRMFAIGAVLAALALWGWRAADPTPRNLRSAAADAAAGTRRLAAGTPAG